MSITSASLYDPIYTSMKDYAKEASQLHTLIKRYKQAPGTRLFDVACGTGGHLPFLSQHYSVEGLDLDEQMLTVARKRLPGVLFHRADMADFELERRFDTIVCLFSSIGYVKTRPRLQQTLRTLRRHLLPGGVLLIEPWLTPQQWQAGYLSAVFVDQPELKITRMHRSELEGELAIMHFHYQVATPQGIEHFAERHELGLFSHTDYLTAIQASGLEALHDPDPTMLAGRGMYIGLAKEVKLDEVGG